MTSKEFSAANRLPSSLNLTRSSDGFWFSEFILDSREQIVVHIDTLAAMREAKDFDRFFVKDEEKVGEKGSYLCRVICKAKDADEVFSF